MVCERVRYIFGIAVVVSVLMMLGIDPVDTAVRPTKLDYRIVTLPNGLKVILSEDHSTPIVHLQLWYHVGSKNEPTGRTGFAHLFEHLMFMGTKNVPIGQFDNIMEGAGGSNNATTSSDRTNYFESGPRELLELFLFLEADRMTGLSQAMTLEKLNTQRGVVRNERRQSYENRPYGQLWLEVPALIYPAGHPYHHPVIVAAETAQFDQMSGGRLILGFGPGGLMSDAELFGMEDMPERYRVAMESIDIILALWNAEAPLRFDGEHFPMTLERRVWLSHGVGRMAETFQKPHPPVALAMVGPGGQTAETIAERDFIPISANFVPVSNLVAQWQSYAQTRERLGKMADPSIWRVCRNVLVTESDAQAQDILADPDGTFAYYYRYIRGVRQIEEFREHQGKPLPELNALLEVDVALEESVIAGSLASVQERLVDLVDQLGPFGTLVMVGQDWDDAVMWPTSMRRMAEEVMPVLTQHADQLK